MIENEVYDVYSLDYVIGCGCCGRGKVGSACLVNLCRCLCLWVWVIRLVKRRYVDALGLILLAAAFIASLLWEGVGVCI